MTVEIVYETHSRTEDNETGLAGRKLEDLMAEDFAWQEGWEHRLER